MFYVQKIMILEHEMANIKTFFLKLNMDVSYHEIMDQRPHYSQKTIDIYYKGIEIGCINDRGQHDLYSFTQKEKEGLKLVELSLGLDRIIELTI